MIGAVGWFLQDCGDDFVWVERYYTSGIDIYLFWGVESLVIAYGEPNITLVNVRFIKSCHGIQLTFKLVVFMPPARSVIALEGFEMPHFTAHLGSSEGHRAD